MIVDGEEQIVLFGADAVGAIKPVAGTTLYARDRKNIIAVALGQ